MCLPSPSTTPASTGLGVKMDLLITQNKSIHHIRAFVYLRPFAFH